MKRSGERITITGTTTLPEGACLLIELTRDGKTVPWWPEEACTTVSGTTWPTRRPYERRPPGNLG